MIANENESIETYLRNCTDFQNISLLFEILCHDQIGDKEYVKLAIPIIHIFYVLQLMGDQPKRVESIAINGTFYNIYDQLHTVILNCVLGQQGGFSLVLHIISATHGSFDLSVPVSLDDSDTCLKQTSGRGFGTEPSDDTCPDDQEKSGALCYPTCPDDFHGSGPVCWQNCPSSTPQKCGAMCTVSESKCLERVASIVKSALEVGVEVLAGIDPLDAEMLIKAAFEVVDTVEDVMSNPYC